MDLSHVKYHEGKTPHADIGHLNAEGYRRAETLNTATLVKYGPEGEKVVKEITIQPWEGEFLRYKYLQADFSGMTDGQALNQQP